VLITILDGKVFIFPVHYSLGKSCMTSFWIGWFFHSFPVYRRFYCLFETGMPKVLQIVVIPITAWPCKGCRPSLWHMQLSFSIRRSPSPYLVLHCFKVRGYILSSSLRFAKHWFIRIVLPSSESPCVSGTNIFEYINHFWLASLFTDSHVWHDCTR